MQRSKLGESSKTQATADSSPANSLSNKIYADAKRNHCYCVLPAS